MKWLPKERRNAFIATVAIIVAILAVIYFGLIRVQYASLSKVAAGKKAKESQLLSIQKGLKNVAGISADLSDATNALANAEADMASGDFYSWTYGTIRAFKQKYKVEIPLVGQPITGDVDLLPSFPYQQLRFTINGTAYYHDLGKFIADFENAFPHARLVNLTIEPSPSAPEKLSFRVEAITLIKSTS